MLEIAGKNKSKSKSCFAYTLAEMLIVMSIVMMVLLALPAATKKVFKMEDTRKSHGRYECYWAVQADGSKKLMTYTAEENGRKVESESAYAVDNKCVFKPTANTIYFMVHAVGGGGAGAQLQTSLDTLTPVDRFSQAIGYLSLSTEASWPSWVTYIKNSKTCAEVPWCDASTGAYKTSFDVNTVSDQQLVRYRLSGTAAKVVSTFIPQLPGNATLEIIPGKGGDLTREGDGSGGDGEPTIINFVYSDKTIEALRARGGAGGDGSIDGRQSFALVGGPPTDFELSSKASILLKESGFNDITESAEKYDALRSKVSPNAGNGGNGETQFVSSTAGSHFYEYDNNQGVNTFGRRIASSWQVVTNLVNSAFYNTKEYFHTTPNCSSTTLPTVEVKREGYCDRLGVSPTPGAYTYKCTVGKNTNTNSTLGCSPNNPAQCSLFTVTWNYTTNDVTISPNITTYTALTPYYGCSFNTTYFSMTCKTKLSNVAIHSCSQTSAATNVCANGDTPVESNGYLKCPARAGGDGAVVILW